MNTDLQVKEGTREVRSAWVAMALSPLGLLASLVVMFAVSTLLDLPILSAGENVIMGGTREPTLLDSMLLFGAGTVTALALPVRAVAQSLRARRLGHPRATVAMMASIVLLVGIIALPFAWNGLMTMGYG